MPGRSEEEQSQREEEAKRQERANRILDAAAELTMRWGYKKTTIDDIARVAGVAKGTIYLHWKTREELFLALLTREKLRAGIEVQQAMAGDPEGVTLHGMARYALLVGLRNPLFRAILLRDQEMLGNLAENVYIQIGFREQLGVLTHLFAYMREHGIIRSDHSIDEQIHTLQSILLGFILADQYLPEELQLSIEKKAELAEDAVRRTFELRNPDQKEKQATFLSYEQLLQLMKKFVQKE